MPLIPFSCRGIECVSHVAQELNFHDMNLLDRYPGNFRPGLVGVGVVVQDLVSLAVIRRQGSWILMRVHLFPSINATVSSLNSLPTLPLTLGLSFFKR